MTTDGQGRALCYGLDWGKTYWLKETTAPAGYTLDPDAHRVVVGEDGSISLVDEQGVSAKLPVKDGVSTMTIKDTRVASLPSTVDTGITPILFAGFCLSSCRRRLNPSCYQVQEASVGRRESLT